MFRIIALLSLSVFIFSCGGLNETNKTTLDNTNESGLVITFGSCSKTSLPQPLWESIMKNRPDAWVWLGDIVYADHGGWGKIKEEYEAQKAIADYQKLEKQTQVFGIWDDHDYGLNDGGKNYPHKEKSRDLLFDFLEIDNDAPERMRAGAYTSGLIEKNGIRVKIILLDCRYFRDDLQPDPTGEQRYLKNEEGDILGETQWAWLEKELEDQSVHFNVIGSGIQVASEEHRYEKWSNFPTALRRFKDLLKKTKPVRPVIITGDRHVAEISKLDIPDFEPQILDVTSSGMTHSFEAILQVGETNRNRIQSKITGQKNFGVLRISGSPESPQMQIEIRGENDAVILEHTAY